MRHSLRPTASLALAGVALALVPLATIACGAPAADDRPHSGGEAARGSDAPPRPPEPPPVSALPGERSEPGVLSREGRVVDGFFIAEGAPDPLACTTDAECVASQTLDATGCCGSFRDMAAAAQSVAYRDWQNAYRAAHCADVACPPPPVPAVPPDCLFLLRCVEGRCDNACP